MGARGFRWRPAHDPGGAANLVRVSGDDGKYRAGRGLLSIVVHYGRSGWQVPGGPTSVKRHWASGELLAVPTHFERRTFWHSVRGSQPAWLCFKRAFSYRAHSSARPLLGCSAWHGRVARVRDYLAAAGGGEPDPTRSLPSVRLRPARHAEQMPGVRRLCCA